MSTTVPHSTENGLQFVEEGTSGKPVVLLIHGSLDRSAGMLRVSRQIQKEAHVIRYDRRGYAHNNSHQGPFTVAGNVADVVSILNGRKSILVGHSFGGNIALATAALLGEQIQAVSTYETPLSWFDWWPRNTAGANSLAVPTADAAEAFMIRLIGRRRWEQLPETTKEARRSEGAALTTELQSIREGAPWTVGDVRCPVLCGYGSRALEHHKKGAIWLGENLTHARSVEIADAGHGAPNSHASDFAKLLIRPHLASVDLTD
jgi:pimeloyl-ACP methyl ester carboxylesterase